MYEIELKAKKSIFSLSETDTQLTYLNMDFPYPVFVRKLHREQSDRTRIYLFVTFFKQIDLERTYDLWNIWFSTCKYSRLVYEAIEVSLLDRNDTIISRQIPEEGPFVKTFTAIDCRSRDEICFNMKVNFLSTDFSTTKGVKGLPMRLSFIVVENLDNGRNFVTESEIVFYSFRDKGADRKHRDDLKKLKQSNNKDLPTTGSSCFLRTYPTTEVSSQDCREVLKLIMKKCLFRVGIKECILMPAMKAQTWFASGQIERKSENQLALRKNVLKAAISMDPSVSFELVALNYYSEKFLCDTEEKELFNAETKDVLDIFLELNEISENVEFYFKEESGEFKNVILNQGGDFESFMKRNEVIYYEIHKVLKIFPNDEENLTHLIFFYFMDDEHNFSLNNKFP